MKNAHPFHYTDATDINATHCLLVNSIVHKIKPNVHRVFFSVFLRHTNQRAGPVLGARYTSKIVDAVHRMMILGGGGGGEGAPWVWSLHLFAKVTCICNHDSEAATELTLGWVM